MKIYKISSPSFLRESFERFLFDEGVTWNESAVVTSAENLVEAAGRICYMSFGARQSPRSNLQYLENLIVQGHESVLEHATWSFILTGISRAFSHQLVRHRIGFSYSQLSQQYHDESEANFVVPPSIASNKEALHHWKDATNAAGVAYRAILEVSSRADRQDQTDMRENLRSIRSDARSVLPNATETKILFTSNARALRHFFETRGATLGDIECRQVSSLIFQEVRSDAPGLFQDFEEKMMEDGFPIVFKNRRVDQSRVPLS